jgi:hypothetical protein
MVLNFCLSVYIQKMLFKYITFMTMFDMKYLYYILKDVTMTWQKWGSKQALEKRKTSLSLMEVFNIALICRVFRF